MRETRFLRQAARENGFTLLEIIIAVAILSTSLVTLLGLQSSIMQQAIKDRDRQNALLVGRRVLAALETSENPIAVGVKSGRIREILAGFAASEDDRSTGNDPALDLQSELQVDYLKLPGVESEQAIKKVVLRIFWGSSVEDSLEVLYLSPETDQDKDEDEDG
ncbi:MAG: type II secretion system protein [SAR324 cluster bacterium]|uniref:Type II secretion system protein n=1 Tax=SAR324 cluster bacterium TaxID=2024889 RepID=A0A7X9IIU7_9DELT|nr:type II secretion system protein [SAR324 cluster bacterium]